MTIRLELDAQHALRALAREALAAGQPCEIVAYSDSGEATVLGRSVGAAIEFTPEGLDRQREDVRLGRWPLGDCEVCGGTVLAPTRTGVPRGTCHCPENLSAQGQP